MLYSQQSTYKHTKEKQTRIISLSDNNSAFRNLMTVAIKDLFCIWAGWQRRKLTP